MSDVEVHPIFPVCFTKHRLGRNLTELELHILTGLEREPITENEASIDGAVLDDLRLQSLRAFLQECLQRHFDTVYNPATAVHPYITQSWVAYCQRGQSHHRHFHSNSFISGVFYVQTAESDSISFHTPRKDAIRLIPKHYTMLNSEMWHYPAAVGDAILFPSWLEHSVRPHQDDSIRVSLAFNSFLAGCLGDDRSKTALYLSGFAGQERGSLPQHTLEALDRFEKRTED